MKKLKTVKVPTSNGEKVVVFRPIEKIPTSHLICDKECPYGKCCSFIPDPRDPGNEELSFIDFCNDLGANEEEDSDLLQWFQKKALLRKFSKISLIYYKKSPEIKNWFISTK